MLELLSVSMKQRIKKSSVINNLHACITVKRLQRPQGKRNVETPDKKISGTNIDFGKLLLALHYEAPKPWWIECCEGLIDLAALG